MFGLIRFPDTWKVLWSSQLDRYVVPVLGRIRGWMLSPEICLDAGDCTPRCVFAAARHQDHRLGGHVSGVAQCHQDIALEACRRELLPNSELGLDNSMHVNANRVADLVPGSLSLVLADHFPVEAIRDRKFNPSGYPPRSNT